MKNIKGVIFDVDGTLTSTNRLIFDSFNYITERYLHKTYSDEDIIKLFGPTEDVIIKDLMEEKFEQAKSDYLRYYRENHKKLAFLYPGIKELVKKLSESTLLSVYTGKGRDTTRITLEETEISKHFDMIISGDDILEFKPSPEGINVFLEKYDLDPKEVLMVGDSPADQQAARSAGCKIASVLWDSYARDNGFWKKSDYVFHTVEELSKFLFRQIDL